MALNRLWRFNPGCSPEPCCGPPAVVTPCCTGLVPTTIYIDDGLGVVPMVYNGPRPVSIVTASDMWWGCASRTTTTGRHKAISGDCNPAPDETLASDVVFGLWCKGPTDGFRLYVFHDGCGVYDNGIDAQTHIIPSLGCSTPWVGQYSQVVAGSINGLPSTSCDPFLWGPYSQTFPNVYPVHPLRGIYGGSATWTITS